MAHPSTPTPSAGRRASRLLKLWLQFQIPTPLLIALAAAISPSGGIGWPLGLGLPAFLILSVCALVAWALESRGTPPGRVLGPTNPASRRRLAWAYLALPWLLAQLVLIPLAWFAAGFSLSQTPPGLAGGLAAYGLGTVIYLVFVGAPLAFLWWRRRPAARQPTARRLLD